MKGSAKRKCLCCGDLFAPDYRNVRHQRYCCKPACRKGVKLKVSAAGSNVQRTKIGLNQNITLYEGQIIDGRNRYAACQKVGFPIDNFITQYEGSDPIGYVISANLRRRHLNTGQRAMIAAKLATAKVGGDHSTKTLNGNPVSRVAKQMKLVLRLSPRRGLSSKRLLKSPLT
jgi:hypothetical protein